MQENSKTTISELEKENRKLKKQLKEKVEFYENLLALMPGHVYWLDTNNIYQGCNNQQADVLKLKSRNDIVGKRNKDLRWVDQASQYDEANQQVLNTGRRVKTKEIVPVDDELKTFLTEKIPLINSNQESVGVLGISIDITELENAQKKAEAANLAKTKFIQNMSHDIRTPLSGIVGLSSILMNDLAAEEDKEHARLLNLSGEQLLSLFNGVLELIASESFEQSLEESSFDLKRLMNELFELELPALKLKNMSHNLRFADNLPSIIKTDKGKLYRILLNLLSNAIKFNNEGGSVTLKVDEQCREADKTTLQFMMTDTGIGIPKTEMDKIFNPFYRVHPSYEGIYEGIGIGLHLVNQYVEMLQGEIEAKSIEGMGSVFTLIIPVRIEQEISKDIPLPEIKSQVPQEKVQTRNNNNQSPAPASQTKYKILLVEDNLMAMKVASSMLKKHGFEIYEAYTATDALDAFKENNFDMILSDIGLPDFSGFELSKKIISSKINCPPIIGLTAHAKQEAELEGQQSGMSEVFEKPLTADKIQTILSYISTDSKAEEEQITPSTTLPLFDEELAITYLGNKKELIEMIEIMLSQSMVETVKTIDEAFENQDIASLKKYAHKFKSSCLYCATTDLLQHTQQLESLAENTRWDTIVPRYEAFKQSLSETKACLETWLQKQS